MRNRRKTWWILGGIGFLVLLIGVGLAYGYSNIQPDQHFKEVETLAKPQPPIQTNSKPAERPVENKNSEPTSDKEAQPFNVLLLGLDGDHSENTRTDVIMVAHINPVNKTVNLLSIPRDTQVQLQGIGLTKINHAHFMAEVSSENGDGTKASIQAVADFLGIPIHYYLKTDFQGFVNFIDDIGGVEIDLPYSVPLDDVLLTKGHQKLNGEVALEFARERYNLPNGDFGRQESQMLILTSIVQKLLQPEYIPRLPSLYSKIKRDIVDTNFTQNDLLSLALLFKGIRGEQMDYFQLPGRSGMARDPLLNMELYYWIPIKGEVKKLIQEKFQ
jgi:polyisoprenyl-teichoic acid--peptidoglycan teichoic acid transferase